jgi:hypothetical protein
MFITETIQMLTTMAYNLAGALSVGTCLPLMVLVMFGYVVFRAAKD